MPLQPLPPILFGSLNDPAMEAPARAFLGAAAQGLPPADWRFARGRLEVSGPFLELTFFDPHSPTRLFIGRENAADLIGMLRESHARTSEQETVTLLARPSEWKDGDRWKRLTVDGSNLELLFFRQTLDAAGTVAILSREERAAVIAAYGSANAPPSIVEVLTADMPKAAPPEAAPPENSPDTPIPESGC